jgi:hypothetical protein
MGCNCGGAKAAPQSFIYTAPDGKQTVYRTEVEARAAQVRDARAGKGQGSYRAK